MAYNSKKPLLVWYRNDELCVYTDHWIKLETVLPNNEIISMAKAKLVWYKDGKLQTYTNKWEEIGEGPTPTPVHVTGVSLNESSASLQPEGTLQLVATVEPADATDKRVTWSSSNSAVASVNNQGLVTAGNTDGEAVITVKTRDGNFTATCSVTVSSYTPEVQEISLAGGEDNIHGYANRGSGYPVHISPYTASNVHFTAVSSDPNVFEVVSINYSEHPDDYSVGDISIQFVGEGEATLTLTSEDNPSVTASYPVTVYPDVRVESISNPSSLSAEAYAYGQKNDIVTFDYSPSNAVLPNEDIKCQLKEGEISIGFGWITKIADGVVGLNFSGEAPAGSSAVYEVYAEDDPSSKYEITITLVEAVTSFTLDVNQLTINAGETDTSVGFTYYPGTGDLNSVRVDARSFRNAELVKDSDGVGHLSVTTDSWQSGTYNIGFLSSSFVVFDNLMVNVQQTPVESVVSNIPNSFELLDNGESKSYTVEYLPSNASNPVGEISIDYVSGDGDEVRYALNLSQAGELTISFDCSVIGSYVYSLSLNGVSQQQFTINCVATPQSIPVQSVSNINPTSAQLDLNGTTTGSSTFDYLPVDADDFSNLSVISDNGTVADGTVSNLQGGTGVLEYTGMNEGNAFVELAIDGTGTGVGVGVEVIDSAPQIVPIASISNLSANSVSIVEGQQDSTITFDYLPVEANDESPVTFVYSDDTVTSANIALSVGTGTAQLIIDGLAAGTSRISIYVDNVDTGLYVDVTVTQA